MTKIQIQIFNLKINWYQTNISGDKLTKIITSRASVYKGEWWTNALTYLRTNLQLRTLSLPFSFNTSHNRIEPG